MSTPSPLCDVKDGAGSYVSAATAGVQVTPGNTVTIRLANVAGVSGWLLSCTSTDETNVAATVNAGLSINSSTKTATLPAPVQGSTLIFTSTVVSAAGSYSTTFKVYTLSAAGFAVLAIGEKREHNATFGYAPVLNAPLRLGYPTVPTGSAGGNLSGTYPNPTVAKVNGATVPAAGALTTGNVPQVSGASALTYGPVNLAGGANYVTGVLPKANQGAQDLAGDVTGNTGASVVAKINGVSVTGTPTTGQVPTATGSTAATWQTPTKSSLGLLGNGQDGAVTFDGSTTILGHAPSSSVYTLTRDIWCTDITINNGVTVKPAGYRIFATGTITNNGTIQANGTSVSTQATAGGVAVTSGFYWNQGKGGGKGGTTNTNNAANGDASDTSTTFGGGGGAGCNGGAFNGGTGGTTSVPAATTGGVSALISIVTAITGAVRSNAAAPTFIGIGGGTGGGGGGAGTGNPGGDGGGGAGVILIVAHAVVNNGTISANGGSGANGIGSGGTGSGGGGGGGGGVVMVFASTFTGNTVTATGGSKGTAGTGGANGSAGTAFWQVI